jgi:hypothetical protein
MVADENRQKQGKYVEKKDIFTFFVLSPLILHIINEKTTLLKEKEISFSPVCLLINIIQLFQSKILSYLAPASVPFNPIFLLFFFIFLVYILLNNYSTVLRKKFK